MNKFALTTKNLRLTTTIIIVATIALLIGWDFIAEFEGGSASTISEITLSFLWHHPAICMAFGALVAHLTWPRRKALTWRFQAIVVGTTLAVVAFVDMMHLLPPMIPLIPVLCGLPVGHFLWSQPTWVEQQARHC